MPTNIKNDVGYGSEIDDYAYCPEVPFNREVKYCYPEIKPDIADVMGLSLLGLIALVAIAMYLVGDSDASN